MANMSYCRFENTYRDLMDCYYNINNQLSDREHSYRERLVELCQTIQEEYDSEWITSQMEEDDDEGEQQVTIRRSTNQ